MAFLQAAITDVQATVRAIDVKVGALFVLVLAPFASLARVFAHVDKLCCRSPKYVFIALSVCFLASWFLALVSLVRAIGALDNPARHIPNSNNQKGTFYGGGLFDFNIIDAFFNRHNVKAKKDLDAFSTDIPTSIEEIEMELAFEHMKVVYIRDIKATRLKWGVRFATIWLILGSSIFFVSRYSIGQ